MSDRDNSLGQLGGTLGDRLRRSPNLDRLHGSLEENLTAAIGEALADGAEDANWSLSTEQRRPPREATAAERVDFQRRAVRAMVSAFGGATRALDREERLRREARLQEEERLRVREEKLDRAEIEDDHAEAAARWLAELDAHEAEQPSSDWRWVDYPDDEEDEDDLYA